MEVSGQVRLTRDFSRENQKGFTQDHSPILRQPGQMLARGVCRHLAELNFATLEEYVPERGRRVDIMALGPKGRSYAVIWVMA